MKANTHVRSSIHSYLRILVIDTAAEFVNNVRKNSPINLAISGRYIIGTACYPVSIGMTPLIYRQRVSVN